MMISEKPEEALTRRQELLMDAEDRNLADLQLQVESCLVAAACPIKVRWQMRVAVEEIFVNIAHYAYYPKTGKVAIEIETTAQPPSAAVVFRDNGIPYNPLTRQDPDTTLSVKERKIGGLGIFMTKRLMDEVSYEYKEGQNVLTLKKFWNQK